MVKIKHRKQKTEVAVAMSGGVDSSVAAWLLKKDDYKVTGFFMRLGNSGEEQPEAAARDVCRRLNVDFYPLNFEDSFQKAVVKYFLNSYSSGITPNPCVRCNRFIKFGELLKRAKDLECDYLATGHYLIRQQTTDNRQQKLFKARDKNKDQSYFLYSLTQEQLKHVLFPLGELTKAEVRKIADREKLPYLKRESQDVCFLQANGKIIAHNEYLKEHLKLKAGLIKDENGKVIGEHKGLPLYTIGQRQGIEIGGTGPYYALNTDLKTNTLFVTNKADDPALYSPSLVASEVSWISGLKPKMPLECQAIIRYRHEAVACLVTRIAHRVSHIAYRTSYTNEGALYLVEFKKPQRAVTPGQSVVFYRGDEVLGGGIIANRVSRSAHHASHIA